MRRKRAYHATAALMMALPAFASAADLQVADNSPAPRFISLQSARSEQKGSPVRVVKPMPLRSDRQALSSGQLRSDARPIALPANRAPLIVRPAYQTPPELAQGVGLVRGGNDLAPAAAAGNEVDPESGDVEKNAVLGLFDDEGVTPLASFYDVMRGHVGAIALGKQGWPLPSNVAQEITSGFGMRSDPFTHKPAFHGGIDIAAPVGTPVLATAAGRVIKVGSDPRYGRYVSLLHADGSESHYGHLDGTTVRGGQQVSSGSVIGRLGSTGRATGPHLDYRISRNGGRLNPMAVLNPPSGLRLASR